MSEERETRNRPQEKLKQIRTERLALRPITVKDLDAVCGYACDPENARYMLFLPFADREEVFLFLQRAENAWAGSAPAIHDFSIDLEGKNIGYISLYLDEEPGAAEFGWILHKGYWGKGYVHEAAAALLAAAPACLDIERFFACCDAENTASWHLMEKLGMRRTGTSAGRKNRLSDELRTEYRYDLPVLADEKKML